MRLLLRPLPLLVVLLAVRCGGGTEPANDGGVEAGGQDAGKDATTSDGGKDATVDAPVDAPVDATLDSSADAAADASGDAQEDAQLDAPADAALDVGAVDAGSVASISGIVLWLDAAKGVTTTGSDITAWADQSGQGNDASVITQSPTLVASSINALPAAHFVAASTQGLEIADATSLQFGTGDYYVAVVAKFDNDPMGGVPTGLGAFYAKLGPSSGLLFFANTIDIQSQTVSAGLSDLEGPSTEVQYASAYNDGAARLYAVQRASGTETLRVGGSVVATSTSAVDVSEVGDPVDLGRMIQQNAAALDGDIAEMIVVKGTLAPTDLLTIETYLKSKYAL